MVINIDRPTYLRDESTSESEYEKIPILRVEHLKPNSTFEPSWENHYKIEDFFVYYFAKALKSPGWLIKDLENQSQKPKHLQHSLDQGWIRFMAQLPNQELLELAQDINTHHYHAATAMGNVDVVARAIELMGLDYPNLAFFRGCDSGFNVFGNGQYSYHGFDFSPGIFTSAINHYKHGFGGDIRKKPLLAIATFGNIGKAYSEGKCDIATEGNWWRGSLEVHIKDEHRKELVDLFRLPSSSTDVEDILIYQQEHSITITDKLLDSILG